MTFVGMFEYLNSMPSKHDLPVRSQ